MSLKWKVFDTRNNNADHIWFHVKQKITKELSKDFVCILEFIYLIPFTNVYQLNKVLFDKNYYSSYKFCY